MWQLKIVNLQAKLGVCLSLLSFTGTECQLPSALSSLDL
jgi:hypothetical protein